jgi:uroporphyrinogen decarboxylase
VNSFERVAAAVKMQPVDRAPVIAQVFAHAAAVCGASVENYVKDGETLARCQLDALKKYGYDAVFSVMDTNVETEALGSVLRYSKDIYPSVERYALSPDGDWSGLSPPDPRSSGRMPEMLRALEIMRRELKNEVLVVGCVLGPFTLAGQLIGLENALYLAVDNPGRLEQLLDFSTEVLVLFGRAQIEAGAHLPIVFDPAASPAVIPPALFRELELPRLKRMFGAFKAAGAIANWIHIAGPAAVILPYYAGAGVDIANFDYNVPMAEARDRLPGTCLDGNIKPLTFVEGAPEEIGEESKKLLGFFRDRGGFILSSGCEIPPESRPENIAAMVRAAETG